MTSSHNASWASVLRIAVWNLMINHWVTNDILDQSFFNIRLIRHQSKFNSNKNLSFNKSQILCLASNNQMNIFKLIWAEEKCCLTSNEENSIMLSSSTAFNRSKLFFSTTRVCSVPQKFSGNFHVHDAMQVIDFSPVFITDTLSEPRWKTDFFNELLKINQFE